MIKRNASAILLQKLFEFLEAHWGHIGRIGCTGEMLGW